MEKAGRQLQWEGCSVFLYRWVLHLLEASNNLAYNRLPYKAFSLKLPKEDPVILHGGRGSTTTTNNNNTNNTDNNNDITDNSDISSSTSFHHSKVMKSKNKSKSKSKCKSNPTWKFMVRRRHVLRLASYAH